MEHVNSTTLGNWKWLPRFAVFIKRCSQAVNNSHKRALIDSLSPETPGRQGVQKHQYLKPRWGWMEYPILEIPPASFQTLFFKWNSWNALRRFHARWKLLTCLQASVSRSGWIHQNISGFLDKEGCLKKKTRRMSRWRSVTRARTSFVKMTGEFNLFLDAWCEVISNIYAPAAFTISAKNISMAGPI